ncbi:hypothetical protein B0H34DRAFT_735688 [Crassisporium funariophilum]|nr:hypothetical protein B0H34DRAFT_735688 [Crassisporium funariophilum]
MTIAQETPENMVSTSIIPLEIVETIIDIVAEDDTDSVNACSLVCQAFLPLCRKHIFASVVLNGSMRPQVSPTTRMFERLLSTTPDIAVYIRKLQWCVTIEDFKLVRSLPKAMKLITRLQSLYVWVYDRNRLKWRSNVLRPALVHLLQLRTLTHLKLFAIEDFPLSDLVPCVNLKELEIERVLPAEVDNGFPSTLPYKPAQLNKFSAGRQAAQVTTKLITALRPDGIAVVDLTELNKVSVKWEKADAVQAAFQLFKMSAQLTDVHMSVQESSLTLAGFSEMVRPSMQTLKSIHLDILIDQELGNDDPLSGLCLELDLMEGRNVVETIEIVVNVQTDSDCKRGDEWGQLDKSLTKAGWSTLREVSLEIHCSRDYREDDDLEGALRMLPETQFTRLTSSKAVDFHFAVTNHAV